MREIIDNFIRSNRDCIPLQTLPIDTYIKILEDYGFDIDDLGDNLNGWSVDFWYYFTNKDTGVKLTLSGSLWYGRYSLCKNSEEETE